MLVAPGRNRTGDPTVETVDLGNVRGLRLKSRWAEYQRILRNRWRNRQRPKGFEPFQDDRAPDGYVLKEHLAGIDAVHLHWVTRFLSTEAIPWLAEQAPLLWTLHDMLPLTGGCHYDHECGRWHENCGACPQLGSKVENDASAVNWQRKKAAFGRVAPERLRFVTPSRWLADQVRASPLLQRFTVSVIPYYIDLDRYRPRERPAIRATLGLPEDRRLLLFVAADLSSWRKGGEFLQQAMAKLADVASVDLVAVGGGQMPIDHPRIHRLGAIDDEAMLAKVFAAADLFVLPSLQDNLPNTMLKALASATPVVAFDSGGIRDFVRPGETGDLVPTGDGDALAEAARQLLAAPDRLQHFGENGRSLVERECNADIVAGRYHNEFLELIGANAPTSRAA